MFDDKFHLDISKIKNVLGQLAIIDYFLIILFTSGFFLLVFGFYRIYLLSHQDVNNCSGSVVMESKLVNEIVVDVSGAVQNPGVYQINYGQRVAEAIEKAGGISDQADTEFLTQSFNLAKIPDDGEKIYVPFHQEQSTDIVSDQAQKESSSLVSVNNASIDDLDALPSIGEKRAQDIIDNRPYTSLNELVEKDVLSQSIFNDIENLIEL